MRRINLIKLKWESKKFIHCEKKNMIVKGGRREGKPWVLIFMHWIVPTTHLKNWKEMLKNEQVFFVSDISRKIWELIGTFKFWCEKNRKTIDLKFYFRSVLFSISRKRFGRNFRKKGRRGLCRKYVSTSQALKPFENNSDWRTEEKTSKLQV